MLEKYPGESAVYDLDCSQLLATGETITGTPAMSFLPALSGGDALTFGTPAVNTGAITYTEPTGETRTVAAGKVIQVRISGGTAASSTAKRLYYVAATFSTNLGNTLVCKAVLQMLPMGS